MMRVPILAPTGRGIAFMCGAVAVLPVMDAVSKHLTEDYGPVQIAAVRFGCLLMLLGPVALRHGGQAALRPAGRGLLLLRGLLLSLSSILFVSALAQVPLATAQFCRGNAADPLPVPPPRGERGRPPRRRDGVAVRA